MQANLTAFVNWIGGEVVKTPEPIALLALGVLFFALSLGGRARQAGVPAPKPVVQPSPHRATPESALATQQSH
jgi:hypothetical protein